MIIQFHSITRYARKTVPQSDTRQLLNSDVGLYPWLYYPTVSQRNTSPTRGHNKEKVLLHWPFCHLERGQWWYNDLCTSKPISYYYTSNWHSTLRIIVFISRKTLMFRSVNGCLSLSTLHHLRCLVRLLLSSPRGLSVNLLVHLWSCRHVMWPTQHHFILLASNEIFHASSSPYLFVSY